MISTLQKTVLLLLSGVVALPLAKPDAPDIRTVNPDLTVPKLSSGTISVPAPVKAFATNTTHRKRKHSIQKCICVFYVSKR